MYEIESRARIKAKTKFNSSFAKGESRACKRRINIKHTSWNCRPNLQSMGPEMYGLLLDSKIHSSKYYIK